MNFSQLPNILTIIRILLIPPVIYFLGQEQFTWALLLFIAAGFSDALDGLLARRFQWRSRFGAIADPLADKLLMVSSFFALSVLGHLPLWLFALVMIRDVVIISGGLIYHHMIGPFTIQPSLLSKFNTFCQITLVFTVFLNLALQWLPATVIANLVSAVVITTVLSGVHYVFLWGRKFFDERRKLKELP